MNLSEGFPQRKPNNLKFFLILNGEGLQVAYGERSLQLRKACYIASASLLDTFFFLRKIWVCTNSYLFQGACIYSILSL